MSGALTADLARRVEQLRDLSNRIEHYVAQTPTEAALRGPSPTEKLALLTAELARTVAAALEESS